MAKKKKSEAGHQPSGLPAHDVPSDMPQHLADMVAAHKYSVTERFRGDVVWHVLSQHKRMRVNTKTALMMVLSEGLPAGYVADQCGLTAESMDVLVCNVRKEVKQAIASGLVPVMNTDAIMSEMLAHPERYTHMMRIVEP